MSSIAQHSRLGNLILIPIFLETGVNHTETILNRLYQKLRNQNAILPLKEFNLNVIRNFP
jgi:hypothetical protein